MGIQIKKIYYEQRVDKMAGQLDRLYYGARGVLYNKLHLDPFRYDFIKKYAGVPIKSPELMNEAIRDGIMSGEPFMTGRFGGFEVFAMQSAEFDDMEKMKRAIDFLDKSAGFFPKDENLLYRFNDIMKEACTQIDILGCWLVNYEDYYIRHYCRNIKSVGKLMAIEPWNVMEKPWSESLEGKRVLVIHPFEKTILSQYEKHDRLFDNPKLLPQFELKTLKSVWFSGDREDDDFDTWFDALDYMCAECEKIDFDVALIGCGAYGFPLAAHIKRMGKQAIHIGGALQILFGIKGRRWDESDTHLLYNENWVYPDESEIPAGAEKVENACYWEVKEEKKDEVK